VSDILLNIDVIIYLISEFIIYILLFVGFWVSIETLIKWDYSSYTKEQYRLEKRAFLVMSITLFAFFIKFLLLPYFVFVIDDLSDIISGAMCGAGVISSNNYGMPLLFFKLLLIFMLILWIALNYYDLESKSYDYFIPKNYLLIAIFMILSLEFGLDILYFLSINPNQPVSCCSALFGQLEGSNPLPFGVNIEVLLGLFFILFVVVELSLILEQNIISIISIPLFLYISYFAIVYFFGTYIYELPTHKCPFCMLQKEYHFIGYLLWGTLFGGSFIGLTGAILSASISKKTTKTKKVSAILIAIFFLVSIWYVVLFFIKNGTLL